jgi:hypothetical protein
MYPPRKNRFLLVFHLQILFERICVLELWVWGLHVLSSEYGHLTSCTVSFASMTGDWRQVVAQDILRQRDREFYKK